MTALPSPSLRQVFSADGVLASAFPHYREREGQLQMAGAVDRAIAHRHHLLVEAGTGIGKTLAYLIPALQSGGRILISTGTKTLQDQLFERDLPRVIRAINAPVTTALLKGRANYLCHYHLGQAKNDTSIHKTTKKELDRIARFAESSVSGDRAECLDVPEDSYAWSRAVSTRENCLGNRCPSAETCFLLKARKSAMDADVLVINHHLFFADMAIRENGGQDLLPTAQVLIFDEAHQIKDIATNFFSDGLTLHEMRDLARDARREMMINAADMPEIFQHADAVEYKSADLTHALQVLPEKIVMEKAVQHEGIAPALIALALALEKLSTILAQLSDRAVGLSKMQERVDLAKLQLHLWKTPPLPTSNPLSADQAPQSLKNPSSPFIHWLEHNSRQWRLMRTPLSIAESMQRQYLEIARSWIFCSATLSLSGDFSLIRRDLGLIDANSADSGKSPHSAFLAESLTVESPFDYPTQSRLYIPAHLPPPRQDEAYFQELLSEILPAIRACRGGVFLLCTSLRAVSWLSQAINARLPDRLILAQQSLPRHQLLAEFKSQGDAVLIGSHSFWEG
jgi:ATP-dependent DNA helicase DinG